MNLEALCKWLRETKGIAKIDLEDLVSYIHEYEKYLENNKTYWTANYIQCDLCSHEWPAVYPEDLDRLECPNCSNMVIFDIK